MYILQKYIEVYQLLLFPQFHLSVPVSFSSERLTNFFFCLEPSLYTRTTAVLNTRKKSNKEKNKYFTGKKIRVQAREAMGTWHFLSIWAFLGISSWQENSFLHPCPQNPMETDRLPTVAKDLLPPFLMDFVHKVKFELSLSYLSLKPSPLFDFCMFLMLVSISVSHTSQFQITVGITV